MQGSCFICSNWTFKISTKKSSKLESQPLNLNRKDC